MTATTCRTSTTTSRFPAHPNLAPRRNVSSGLVVHPLTRIERPLAFLLVEGDNTVVRVSSNVRHA